MNEPGPVVNPADLPLEEGGNGGRFVRLSARLGARLGLSRLGCSVVVVPPGKRAYPYHAHSLIEEMFVILEGHGTLRHDGRELPIRAGDVIGSALGKAHQIVNTSEAELRYLAISANERADVVLYPDSNKVQAVSGAFGEMLRHVTRLGDATDYYDGEE